MRIWDYDNMIIQVQFFKNSYGDNHNRITKINQLPNKTLLESQNEYYSNLTDKKEIDGNFNKFGEPITIVGDYGDYCGYNYGRFKYRDKYYYFSVVDYIVINETKLNVIYAFDYYETSRYQFNVSIGKGTINNITKDYPNGPISKIPKSDNGLGIQILSRDLDNSYYYRGVVFYVYNSPDRADINGIYIYKCPSETAGIVGGFYAKVLNGDIVNELIYYMGSLASGFDVNDIRGAWLVPNIITDNILDNSHSWVRLTRNDVNLDLWKHSAFSTEPYNDFTYTKRVNLKRTDTEYTAFIDYNGSVIWDMPTGFYFDTNRPVHFTLDVCASSCELKMSIDYRNMSFENVVYPLPAITVFNNTYLEYTARQRQADIELRHTNNQQQLTNGLVNIGSSVIGGGVAGAMAGGKSGAGIGAGAGFVSGYVSAVGGYFVNEYYGNIQQNIIDNQYKRAVNNMLLHGNSLIERLDGSVFGFYNVYYYGDLGTNRTNKIIETYGIEINQHYPNIQEYIDYLNTLSTNEYVRGSFEINGAIPDNWKRQIQDRFNGGVTFGI